MTDETTKAAAPKKASALEIFCKRSGYSPEDVLAQNEKNRVFVTTNGGKYVLTASGVRRILGPTTPKEKEG